MDGLVLSHCRSEIAHRSTVWQLQSRGETIKCFSLLATAAIPLIVVPGDYVALLGCMWRICQQPPYSLLPACIVTIIVQCIPKL